MQQLLLYIHWNPSREFISFGSFAIQWYGIFWGLGLLSCYFIGQYIFKKLKHDEEKLVIAIQYAFVGALIGARLAHILFYALDYYIAHPLDILAIWKGGLASHGGAVGWFIGLYIFCRRNKDYSFFWVIDHGAIMVGLLSSLIRLGNLFNSELCGKQTDVPWAFIFEKGDVMPLTVPRHPVVLYESIAYFFIQLLLLYLFRKYKESKPGIYVSVFLSLVFGVRFLLEFYKVPDGEMILNLISKTQLLNIPLIIAGIVLFYLTMKKKLHYKNAPPASV